MGQAKNRGTFEQRQAVAVEAAEAAKAAAAARRAERNKTRDKPVAVLGARPSLALTLAALAASLGHEVLIPTKRRRF